MLFALALAHAEPGLQSSAEALSWLRGCWTLTWPDGSVTTERWFVEGDTLLGVGATVAGGALVEHEFLAIRKVDGVLSYVAAPSGQAMATFPVAVASPEQIGFENRAHDFPQRISYRKVPDGISARIEGEKNGKVKSVDFAYKRCPT